MLPPALTEAAGWLPAVILPVSTGLQLGKLLRARTAAGTSATAWALFAVANFGAWIFTARLLSPQALLAFFLPAVLDIVIVGLCLRLRTPPGGGA